MTPIFKAGIVGVGTMLSYLLVVVLTTPALDAFSAISAAFQLNSIVIIGMSSGVGLQIFFSEKAKRLGCKLGAKKKTLGGNSGSTVMTSFFSFFSLVPLGCCGWWLYLLSLLPSVFGAGITSVLIDYSQPLSYIGIGIIFGFVGITGLKLRHERIRNLV